MIRSFPETAVYYYVKKHFPFAEQNARPDWLDGKELDVYIPDKRIGIEYDGSRYHKNVERDVEKNNICLEHGVKLIRIREPRCPELPSDITCLVLKDRRKATLSGLIRELCVFLNGSCDVLVDVKNDEIAILEEMELYIKTHSLAVLRPSIAEFWDYAKNGSIMPTMIPAYSSHRFHWKCKTCGYEWCAPAGSVNGCPACAGHAVVTGVNDLATLYPDLLKEWDWEKNTIDPQKVTAGADVEVHWRCEECGYPWHTRLYERTGNRRTACPACAGKAVFKGHNDLETKCPELAKMWNKAKNKKNPCDYTLMSNARVWWTCKHSHEWDNTIYNQYKLMDCPICNNSRLLKGYNDIVTVYPELAKEWDYDGNNGLKPEDILCSNVTTKFSWRCVNGHPSWKATLDNRVRVNSGCPYCAGKKAVSGVNDLKTLHPQIAAEWDYEKNGSLRPENCTCRSGKKVWWICEYEHSWDATIASRVGNPQKGQLGSGCPYCSGRKAIKGQNDLMTVYPELVIEEWDYEKNVNIKPEGMSCHSGKKVWWKRKDGGPSYQASVDSRVRRLEARKKRIKKGKTVSANYKSPKAISGYNDLATLRPDLCKEWDYEKNKGISPEEVTVSSGKIVWWKCHHGHPSWPARVDSRARLKTGCPFCSGRFAIPGVDDLLSKYPVMAKEWDEEKNKMPLSLVKVGSGVNAWWKCPHCNHTFQKVVRDRTKRKNPEKCPSCNGTIGIFATE